MNPIEVETALRRRVPIIPVLIGTARMPDPEQLPSGLKDFAFKNALRVDTGQDFDYHMDRLVKKIDFFGLDHLGRAAGKQPSNSAGIQPCRFRHFAHRGPDAKTLPGAASG